MAARRIEKTSAGSGLNDRGEDHAAHAARAVPRLQVELVYQDDTRAPDPFRDTPRLVPAFVTQLLGQVMTHQDLAPACVSAAYDRAAPGQARLLDRRS